MEIKVDTDEFKEKASEITQTAKERAAYHWKGIREAPVNFLDVMCFGYPMAKVKSHLDNELRAKALAKKNGNGGSR